MPKQAKTKTAKRGRPATGQTKRKLSATIDKSVYEMAERVTKRNGESLSSFVSRALEYATREAEGVAQ